MAIGYGELMHECSPKHSRMVTVRIKYDNETAEEGKKKCEYGKKWVRKKEAPTPYHYLFIIQ